MKITTESGTRTVTFLKNKTTGKWVSDVAEQVADGSPALPPASPAVQPQGSPLTPAPRKEESASKVQNKQPENFDGFN